MEKKEYKQPEIKVVEIEEKILADSDTIVEVGPGGQESATKGGSLDFDTED